MWDYVDFWLAVLAGFAAGYVMALGAYWLETVIGMVRLDFGHTGMKYVGGEKPGWWAVGMIFHLIDSALLGLAYAAFVWPFLPLVGIPILTLWGDILGGVIFGIVVWLGLAMLIAMPMMGAGVFGHETKSIRPAALSLGLHILFGALLGLIYIPQ
ncbi:MAG: hypothetical protein HYY30_05440 [Chloroflexi bacterium]|nr:hypothetical protein [Chloroflexota bacterium]